MLIYHRHLLRELLWNFAFTFVAISMIFMIAGAIRIIYEASVLDPFLFFLAIPLLLLKAMAIVIPLSVLVSVVITFGRVAADGELTTLKAAGVHPFAVLPPPLALASIAAFSTLMINDRLAPQADYQSKSLFKESNIRKLLELRIREGHRSFDQLDDTSLTWRDEDLVSPAVLGRSARLPYLIAGPFGEGAETMTRSVVWPPETNAVDPSETFTENGTAWQRIDADILDAPRLLNGNVGTYYAVTHLRCAQPAWVRLRISPAEADDTIRFRGQWRSLGSGSVELALEPGAWNEVMIKTVLSEGPRRLVLERLGGGEEDEGDVFVSALPGTICLYDLTIQRGDPEAKGDSEPLLAMAGVGIIGFDGPRRMVKLELRNIRSLRDEGFRMGKFEYAYYIGRTNKRIKLRQRTGAELFALAKRIQRQPEHSTPVVSVQAQLHDRLVTSTACFVFVLLGLPIAVIFRSANRAVAFVLAFAIVLFFYYPTLILGRSLAEQGAVDPAVAMWSGNVLLSLLGGALLLAVVRR